MSPTTPAPDRPHAIPHRAGPVAVATLFAIMAALLLAAILVALLSGPAADVNPRPAPALAPGPSR